MKILAHSTTITIILVLFIFQCVEAVKDSALSFALLQFNISFRLESIFFLLFQLKILLQSHSFLLYFFGEFSLLLQKFFKRSIRSLGACLRFESTLIKYFFGLFLF